MAATAYNSFLYDALRGQIDLDTDSFKVMLTTSSYTEDVDTHTKRSDVTNEVTGTGYTAGGVAVVPTITNDTANNRVAITFPEVTIASSTLTARKAVYYKARGGAASADELVMVNAAAADVVTSAGTLTIGASTVYVNLPVSA